MSNGMDRSALLTLLDNDRELVDLLLDAGFLSEREEGFLPEEVEAALVARDLWRELEVNWAGVEIILRMRSDMVALQRQVAELIELLRRRAAGL